MCLCTLGVSAGALGVAAGPEAVAAGAEAWANAPVANSDAIRAAASFFM